VFQTPYVDNIIPGPARDLLQPSLAGEMQDTPKLNHGDMSPPSMLGYQPNAELRPADYKGESVDIYLNSTCNLKCKTCFLGNDYFASTNNMSVTGVAAILRWAKAAGVRDVAFLGGEPSLHPHVGELLELSRSTGIPTNRFVTNGSRPFQKLLSSSAAEYIDLAYVSLDGATAESNDRVRGKGSFAQAVKSMTLLNNLNVPFVITTSITPASYQQIKILLDLAEESGCKTLNIHWVSPTGRARDGQSSMRPKAWLDLCQKIVQYVPKRPNLELQCQAAYAHPQTYNLRFSTDDSMCAVRDRTNLQFMPDNSVYACGLLVDRPGLNGYRWTGQSLTVSSPPSELAICAESSLRGCPVRRKVVPEVFTEEVGYVPLCIYQRLHHAPA
jgi:MoaA/NifB/PqqE/SkfB family radical SAM enzyme